MKSKIIALLLVGAMTGLAACDGGSKETTPGGGASPAGEAPAGTTKSPSASETPSSPAGTTKSTESSPAGAKSTKDATKDKDATKSASPEASPKKSP